MGFADLFASFSTLVEKKIAIAKVDLWTTNTSLPEEPLLVSYEKIAKRDALPVLAADYVRMFQGSAVHPKGWESEMGDCLSGTTCGTYCTCGGVPIVKEPATTKVISVPSCAKGRNFCKGTCRRHGGTGCRTEFIAAVLDAPCRKCNGSGVVCSTEPICHLREAARRAKAYRDMVSVEIPDDIFLLGKRYFDMQSRMTSGMDNVEGMPTFSSWLNALAISAKAPLDYFRNSHRFYGCGAPDEKWGGPRGCHKLPTCTCCVRKVEQWYLKSYLGDVAEETSWWEEYVKPRLGFPTRLIEKSIVKPKLRDPFPRVTRIQACEESWDMFLLACQANCVALQAEEDIFEDAADSFESTFYCNDSVALKRVLLDSPSKQVAKCVSARASGHSPRVPILSMQGSPSELPKRVFCADMVKDMETLTAYLLQNLPVMKMDQEQNEEIADHRENKQGGELLSTPEFIKILREKKQLVRNKEFKEATEGRLKRAADFKLNKHDVFLANSLLDKLRKSSLVSRFAGKNTMLTHIAQDMTNSDEVVRFPPRKSVRNHAEESHLQTFNVLNRPQYKELNRLAESGWKEARSVVLNLHLRSYLPHHFSGYAFCVIMWGHSANAQEASLSGCYTYLGDGEATMLQLPLLNSHIGSCLDDFEAYGRSLVLSTVFPNYPGIASGTAMFGITAIEFTEYFQTSQAGLTHERDSWDAMLRKHGEEQRRFISGFNVVDVLEKSNEEPFSFPSDINLKPVPRHQPIVRTFENQDVGPILKRSSSMRVKTFKSFQGANIPVNFLGSNVANAEPRRLSSADNLQTRFASAEMRSSENFVFTQLVSIPKAVTAGQVLAGIDLLGNARSTMSAFYTRWLKKGYVDTNLAITCHLPRAPFAGLSFYLLVDGTGRLARTNPSTLNESVLYSYPLHLVTTSDADTYVFNLDWVRYIGQVPFVEANSFLQPTLFVVACTNSALALSANSSFYLEAQSYGEELVRTLVPEATLNYPFNPACLEDLDLYLPPKSINLGEREVITIPLSFAQASKDGDSVLYSHAAARLSHFQGVGGIMHGRIYMIGSSLVACKLRISMWDRVQHMHHLSMNVHVDTDVGAPFSLQIKDAFYASSVYGDSGALVQITPLCTPISPAAISAPFDVVFHLRGFTPDLPLCRTINFTRRFGWFAVAPTKDTSIMSIKMWPVSNHIDSATLDITGYTNAFLQMCACSTLHYGKVIIHLSWTLFGGTTKMADAGGTVSIFEGFGPENEGFRGQCNNYSIFDGEAAVPLELGTFAGPTPLHRLDFKYRNWIIFRTNKGKQISSLFASIEVLPGFSFFGRTGSPKMIIGGSTQAPLAPVGPSAPTVGTSSLPPINPASEDIGDMYAAAIAAGRGGGYRPGPNPPRQPLGRGRSASEDAAYNEESDGLESGGESQYPNFQRLTRSRSKSKATASF